MKNITKKIDKNIIFIFIASFAFYALFSNTNIASLANFDNQTLQTWSELAKKGYLPYRDLYYPYGILYFFKHASAIFNLIYITILSIINVGLFLFFKKLIKNTLLSFITTLGILIFTIFHVELTTFSRYGTILIILIYYSYFLFTYPDPKKKYIFLLGAINGLIFSLIYDQGIASIGFFFLLITLSPLLRNKMQVYRKRNYYINLIENLFIFCVGIFIGMLPFIYYLINTNSLTSFIFSINHLSETIFYAKAPFFNFLFTPANLLIMIPLCISIWIIIYHFYKKLPFSFVFYSILNLTTLLIFLQLKSIIRSIANELSFIAVILLIVNAIYLNTQLHGRKTQLKIVNIFVILIFAISFISIKIIPIHWSLSQDNNLKTQLQNNKKYSNLINYLKTLSVKDDEQIFSYPGNPAIYLTLNKKPPYYFSTYEGSPTYAKDGRLAYLENPKTIYAVLDTNMLAIQDGVPEYIRSSEELKYLLTNFYQIKQVENFIILKKSSDNSMILKNLDLFSPEFKSYLLNIDFKNIPNAQGKYKTYKSNLTFEDWGKLSAYIQTNRDINKSNDISLVLFTNSKEKIQTMIIANAKYSSRISFYACTNNPCIINLSKIPLFYMTDKNEKFTINFSEPLEKIDVFTVKSNSSW